MPVPVARRVDHVYTDFVTPDDGVVDDLVHRALHAAAEHVPTRDWRRVDHGSANLVVLAGHAAVRVARTPTAAREALRAQALVDALPPLPFDLPLSLAPAVHESESGLIAIAQRRVHGAPHPSGSGDPRALRKLLDALRSVSPVALRPHLAHRHAFFGGVEGLTLMADRAVPMLTLAAQNRARRVVDTLAGLESDVAAPVLAHGDLAGSNVLWSEGQVGGVIDWDLAAESDEATDVAALATWHGWGAVASIVSPEVERRARAMIDSYPLQLLCFAIAGERPQYEVERAVARADALYSA